MPVLVCLSVYVVWTLLSPQKRCSRSSRERERSKEATQEHVADDGGGGEREGQVREGAITFSKETEIPRCQESKSLHAAKQTTKEKKCPRTRAARSLTGTAPAGTPPLIRQNHISFTAP